MVGEMTITEQRDDVLHRISRVARVIDFQRRPIDLLPPLFDATLLWMSNDQLAVTGFERVDTTSPISPRLGCVRRWSRAVSKRVMQKLTRGVLRDDRDSAGWTTLFSSGH
jgi:hypothetical protein